MAFFKTKAQHSAKSTQAYLDIAAIKDGVVILKSGGLRAILEVTSVNFALKSSDEQEDIVLRYQGFLNSLHFPLQITMQSRKLDLTDYIAKLKARAEAEANESIRTQTTAYVAFMERLLTVVNIMDKRFFVVIPFDPPALANRGLLDRVLHPVAEVTTSMTEKEFGEFSDQLGERVGLIESGLSSMGLRTGRLNTRSLIELYYLTYNPEEAVRERLSDATALATQYVGDETLPGLDGASPPSEGAL